MLLGIKIKFSLLPFHFSCTQRLGVPIKITSRIQLNVMNGETKFNTQVKKFDHLTIPILWIECVSATKSLQSKFNYANFDHCR